MVLKGDYFYAPIFSLTLSNDTKLLLFLFNMLFVYLYDLINDNAFQRGFRTFGTRRFKKPQFFVEDMKNRNTNVSN